MGKTRLRIKEKLDQVRGHLEKSISSMIEIGVMVGDQNEDLLQMVVATVNALEMFDGMLKGIEEKV